MKFKNFTTGNETVLSHPYIHDCLVYDIETDSLNTDTARMKFIGFYSYKYRKYLMCDSSEKETIQMIINDHKILIGFNNKWFDGPILENETNNYDLMYKIVIDCLGVLYDHDRKRPNRENIIKLKCGKTLATALKNRKLKTIAKVLGFPISKGDIDYKIFTKNVWSNEELQEIYTYLYKDIDLTRRLFEYYLTYFDGFRELVPEDNIKRLNYVRQSTGSFAYSAVCHLAGLPLEFEEDKERKKLRPVNDGGFVLLPQVNYAEGTIIYADFTSMYPHLMFMCNLFSPVEEGGWSGGGFFDLQGQYKKDSLGKIELVLKNIYMKRRELKKQKNPKELGYKIVINSIYGISGSPIFKSVFNMTTSGDTTAIGRKIIQYTKECFEKEGYKVIYGDTDSCFIHLPNNKSMNDFKILADITVKDILRRVPFPVNTFKLEIDDVFKKVWLFAKKHYVAINEDNKLIIKGLPIIKHDASQLGQVILKRLKPLIKEKKTIKFTRQFIEDLINEELRKDITLIGRIYNVRSPDSYKSTTAIQCQIAQKFGEGSHLMIPNKTLGDIGKAKKYCTADQALTLSLSDLFLDKVWKELEPFVEEECNQI